MKNFRKQMLANDQEAKGIRNAVLNMTLKGAATIINASLKSGLKGSSAEDYMVVAFFVTDNGEGIMGAQNLHTGRLEEDTNPLRATYNHLRKEVALNGQALSNPTPEEDDQYLATVSFGGIADLDAKLVDGDGKPLTGEGLMVTVNFADDTHALFVVEAADGGVRFGTTSGDTDIPLIKVSLQPVSDLREAMQSVIEGSEEEIKFDPEGDHDSNFWAALISGISTASPSEYDMFPTFATDAD